MATLVELAGFVLFGATDLSDHAEMFEIEDEFAEVDFTNFGSGGNQVLAAGLGNGAVTILWQQDYAASKVDATLWAARGTLVTIELRATSGARSATNPAYVASYLISKYKPISGKVGDKAGMTLTWKRSGALQRLTS